jgi:hypothetical protein
MANFSYADYAEKLHNSNEDREFKVGFFNLRDDGDTAVVRFAYNSVEEFTFATVHSVKLTNKEGKESYRRISCLRGINDPIEKCPLCLKGIKIEYKFFVKLIEYIKTEDGQIIPKAKVWERPAKFALKLKPFFDEYGNLTNYIFKIKRRGVRGSLKTDYDIIPAATMADGSSIYSSDIYAKDFSDFNEFKTAGSSYLIKTADEMRTYLNTGHFPATIKKEDTSEHTPMQSTPTPVTLPHQSAPEVPIVTTNPTPSAPIKSPATSPTDGRPQRYTSF